MIDFATVKSVTIPEGVVTQISANGVVLWGAPAAYTNLVRTSIDTDGSIYNGVGYMDDYRLNSSGEIASKADACHTGYIAVEYGAVIRAKVGTADETISGNYIVFCASDFAILEVATISTLVKGSRATFAAQSDGRYLLTMDTANAGYTDLAYIRVSAPSCEGADMIVTADEEIT